MMLRLHLAFVFVWAAATSLWAQSPPTATSAATNAAPSQPAPPLPPVEKLSADDLVKKMQAAVLTPTPGNPPEGFAQPGVPHGEYVNITVSGSKIFPGTTNSYSVYVPKQYDPAKPACLLVSLDGFGGFQANVLDNLIARGEIPVMIAIGISPLVVSEKPQPNAPPGAKPKVLRWDRGYEFDSVNDHFPDYVVNEVLSQFPKLKTKDGRPIVLSPNASDHMTMGGSSGGIGAFTLAWKRPDVFGRVYTTIGTYVSMRGGHEYPYLIRKTDPKPLRIFLEDGETDAWNPLFGSWYEANVLMNSAFTFAGYDEAHAWGKHGHSGQYSNAIFPDAMRWMWRDYPAPIKPGISQNSTLKAVTLPGEGWQTLDATFQSAAGLSANAKGDVFLCDGTDSYQIGADGKSTSVATEKNRIAAQALGSDGTFYWLEPDAKQVVARAPDGTRRVVAEGIAGHGLTVTHDGTIYVSEPGQHSDMPSQIWQIKPDGTKAVVDQGLSSASGVAFSPDGQLFYAAEGSTKWVYTYIVQPDGTFADKQSFYWLHMTDIPNNSGAEDICCDSLGNLYVATRMGIQIGDTNGRVRAILPLPTPTGAARSLCFGGPKFDVLYATDGVHVFKRQMKVPGVPPWSPPVTLPSAGGS
jgi:gluconolactonase